MKLDEVVELWLMSLTDQFAARGNDIKTLKSPRDRPKCSFNFTLRKGQIESDFTVWDSGEGELSLSESGEEWIEESLTGLEEAAKLTAILARIADLHLSVNR